MVALAKRSDRLDWKTIRDSLDLAAVATGLLGPAPGRRAEHGRRLWWLCPFHGDRNPSLCIEPGKAWWRCYGCGEKGDAATLVMKVVGCTFPEAVAYLTGPPVASQRSPRRSPSRRPEPDVGPEGMSEAEALGLVAESVECLWSDDGRGALAYLTGPERLLSAETIRAARLGYAPSVRAVTKDGRPYEATGIVIPWYAGGRLALVKVRQPEGRRPKYAEVYRDRARHSGIYPGIEAIRPGCPLIIVEGDFDELLLGQELGDLAAVVTLGSASIRPEPAILGRMLAASPWYIAMDNDPAGDKSAAAWPGTTRRARPPGSFKDWTEAKAGGVDLARWWRDVLAGVEQPPLFTWPELAALRWDGADETAGIVIDRPDRDRRCRALDTSGGGAIE
jgi:hypothetical protein